MLELKRILAHQDIPEVIDLQALLDKFENHSIFELFGNREERSNGIGLDTRWGLKGEEKDYAGILEFICQSVQSFSTKFETRKVFAGEAELFKNNLSKILLQGKILNWDIGKTIKFGSIAFDMKQSPLEKNQILQIC